MSSQDAHEPGSASSGTTPSQALNDDEATHSTSSRSDAVQSTTSEAHQPGGTSCPTRIDAGGPMTATPAPASQSARPKRHGLFRPARSAADLEAEIASVEAKLTQTLARLAQVSPPSGPGTTSRCGDVAGSSAAAASDGGLRALDDREALVELARGIFARHVGLLKGYNEIKDVAMGMLSLIAEKEGKRLAEVMEERGVRDDE